MQHTSTFPLSSVLPTVDVQVMPYPKETFDQKSVRLRGRGGGEWKINDTLKGLMKFPPKKGLTTY